MRRILRILPRALAIAGVAVLGTFALSACDEWFQGSGEQEQQRKQQEQAPPAPPPQP